MDIYCWLCDSTKLVPFIYWMDNSVIDNLTIFISITLYLDKSSRGVDVQWTIDMTYLKRSWLIVLLMIQKC